MTSLKIYQKKPIWVSYSRRKPDDETINLENKTNEIMVPSYLGNYSWSPINYSRLINSGIFFGNFTEEGFCENKINTIRGRMAIKKHSPRIMGLKNNGIFVKKDDKIRLIYELFKDSLPLSSLLLEEEEEYLISKKTALEYVCQVGICNTKQFELAVKEEKLYKFLSKKDSHISRAGRHHNMQLFLINELNSL